MTVDDLTKLIYAFGITGSVIAVSFFLIRLLNKLSQRADELEDTTRSMGEVSDRLAGKMDEIENMVDGFSSLSRNFLQPMEFIGTIVKYAKEFMNTVGLSSHRGDGEVSEEEYRNKKK